MPHAGEDGDLFPKFGGGEIQLLRSPRVVQLFRQGDCRSFLVDGNGFGHAQLLAGNPHQIVRMASLLRWLCQLRDADTGQKHSDSVIHPLQWLFRLAVTCHVAVTVNGRATGDDRRAIERGDDIECADRLSGTGDCQWNRRPSQSRQIGLH
jgi:hypothetical protein